MPKILYAMHFIGQTSRMADQSEVLHTNCVVSTVVLASGLQTELRAAAGDLAFFESELRFTGAGEFQEGGEIVFGDGRRHVLRFSTLGLSHVELGPEPDVMAGAASWKVDGGGGQFSQARGLIPSNFTINGAGERSGFQCGLIFASQ